MWACDVLKLRFRGLLMVPLMIEVTILISTFWDQGWLFLRLGRPLLMTSALPTFRTFYLSVLFYLNFLITTDTFWWPWGVFSSFSHTPLLKIKILSFDKVFLSSSSPELFFLWSELFIDFSLSLFIFYEGLLSFKRSSSKSLFIIKKSKSW